MQKPKVELEKLHIEFIKSRLKSTNFHAREKLLRIEELADLIFTAKENYKKNK